MVDIQRAIIRHSIDDVIRILENEPVKEDMVPEITIVQVMNRVSIAHLSIERAFKFLITRAGGPLVETHDLRRRYEELQQYDLVSSKVLEETFHAAVGHYGYNPNSANMTHLKSLDTYLGLAGSNQAFKDIRYWELTQSLNEMLLRRVYLMLHIELLHGLVEILLAPNRPTKTVANRVERAVESAMWHTTDLAYGPGTPKEHSVRSYIRWRQEFNTWSEALADAVQKGFNIGDDFMANVVRNAYNILLGAADRAVSYFASTLDVLPRQSREVIPCVEWLGPEKERSGSVKTPAGTALGFINRGLDGLWYITPLRDGLVGVSAKARSQTDARCYLAILLTKPATVTVGGGNRALRIVGGEYNLFQRNYDQTGWSGDPTGGKKPWTHKVTFWDIDSGIKVHDVVRIVAQSGETEGMITILEGTATVITGSEVYVSGHEVYDIERKGDD